jgi:hypothetical protein
MSRISHILLLLIFLAFPHRLLDYLFTVLFFLTTPPQYHEPSISSTINLPICEPNFISPTSYRNSPMGPPPFISFPSKLCPTWATHITLGHLFLYLYISPQNYSLFIVQTPFHYIIFLSSPLETCFLPFGQTQPMSHLVGELLIIYPFRHRPYLQSTPQVTYLYPLNVFTLSRL